MTRVSHDHVRKSENLNLGQDTRANWTRHTSSSSTRPHAEHRHTKAHTPNRPHSHTTHTPTSPLSPGAENDVKTHKRHVSEKTGRHRPISIYVKKNNLNRSDDHVRRDRDRDTQQSGIDVVTGSPQVPHCEHPLCVHSLSLAYVTNSPSNPRPIHPHADLSCKARERLSPTCALCLAAVPYPQRDTSK